MTPERQDLERQLDAITAQARSALEGLSGAQVNWRPAPDRWSMGDCISHLNVGMRVVLPALDRSIADARARGFNGPGSGRYGWFANMVARSMEPPPRWRSRTVPILLPESARHDAAALLADFVAVRDQLRQRLSQADDLDWTRARVISPVSRFFRMPFGAYVRFLLAHDRRHLWQARHVRASAAFPA